MESGLVVKGLDDCEPVVRNKWNKVYPESEDVPIGQGGVVLLNGGVEGSPELEVLICLKT